MTAKEYLSQLTDVSSRVRLKAENLATLRAKLDSIYTSPSFGSDTVNSSQSGDSKHAKIISKILEMEDKLDDDTLQYVEMRDQIVSEILSIKNPIYQQVLYSRYVDDASFLKIAVDLDLTDKRVYQVHGEALEAFRRYVLERSENN